MLSRESVTSGRSNCVSLAGSQFQDKEWHEVVRLIGFLCQCQACRCPLWIRGNISVAFFGGTPWLFPFVCVPWCHPAKNAEIGALIIVFAPASRPDALTSSRLCCSCSLVALPRCAFHRKAGGRTDNLRERNATGSNPVRGHRRDPDVSVGRRHEKIASRFLKSLDGTSREVHNNGQIRAILRLNYG